MVSGCEDGTVRLWDVSSGECLRILRSDRRYERADIAGLTGVTAAQRAALVALGAVDHQEPVGRRPASPAGVVGIARRSLAKVNRYPPQSARSSPSTH